MLPVQECVPFAGIQVTLSVLSSTLWMPESSEAFPATVIVTVGVKTKLEFLGELMAICGGVVSGTGSPARTSTVIETVWTRLPCRAVPKTSTVYHPSAVPDRVQVEVPLPSIVEGEQVAVIPPGTDAAVRSTGSAKPPEETMPTMAVVGSPARNETLSGSAYREKSGWICGSTVTAIVALWTRLPFVPVTMTAKVPGTEPSIVHVDVSLPWRVEGVQLVDRPDGEDSALRSTGPLNPPVDCKWIVDVADCPATKERLVGSAGREKSGIGTGETLMSIGIACVRLPLVPVMVAVYDPIELAFSVHVADALPTRLEGEQVVVTPIGAEAVVRSTVPENPLTDGNVTVDGAESLTMNETLVGVALREKSGVVTVAATAVLWATLPFVPVIVTV